jgi:hypothetical protein
MPVPDAIARAARAGDWRIPNERDCIRVAGAYISSAEALPQLRLVRTGAVSVLDQPDGN